MTPAEREVTAVRADLIANGRSPNSFFQEQKALLLAEGFQYGYGSWDSVTDVCTISAWTDLPIDPPPYFSWQPS